MRYWDSSWSLEHKALIGTAPMFLHFWT